MYINNPIIIINMFVIENAYFQLQICKLFVKSSRVLFKGEKIAQSTLYFQLYRSDAGVMHHCLSQYVVYSYSVIP